MLEVVDFFENSPNWRWELVRAFVEEDRIPNRRPENDRLRKGVTYLKRWKNSSRSQLPQIKGDYPVLYSAHSMYCNAMSEAWIVQAGLLTDVTFEGLAKYVGQSAAVIEEYAYYFYDVRDKLGARGYVLNQITMPAVGRGLHARDFDFMFKVLAYCCGWEIFTEFIDHKASNPKTRDFLQENFKEGLMKLGWAATKRLELNNYNALEVINACLQLQSIEKEQGGEAAKDAASSMLNDLLLQCKIAILPTRVPMTVLSEPRAQELLGAPQELKYGEPIPLESKK